MLLLDIPKIATWYGDSAVPPEPPIHQWRAPTELELRVAADLARQKRDVDDPLHWARPSKHGCMRQLYGYELEFVPSVCPGCRGWNVYVAPSTNSRGSLRVPTTPWVRMAKVRGRPWCIQCRCCKIIVPVTPGCYEENARSEYNALVSECTLFGLILCQYS